MSVEKLLNKLGVSKETIEKVGEEGFDMDSFIDDWDQSQRTTYFELYKNSSEYKEAIETAGNNNKEGIYKTLDQQFKKYLDKDEMTANKLFTEKLVALVEKLGKSGDSSTEEFQTEILDLKKQLEDKDSESAEAIKKIISEVNREKVNLRLRKTMDVYKDDQIAIDKGAAYTVAEVIMNQKYDFKLIEDNIVPFVKGTDKKAEKGSKFATVEEILNDTLEESKLLKHSNPSEPDKGKPAANVSKRTGEEFKHKSARALEIDKKLGITA